MKRMNRTLYAWLLPAVALTLPVLAQTQPSIRSVSFVTIKADRVGDFQAAVKDYVALAKKAGSEQYYSVWASNSGPREFVRVDYHSKWAEFDVFQDPKMKDQAGQAAAISMRINQTIESSRRVIDVVIPDLTLPRTGTMPAMVRTLRTVVKPDRVNDYIALLKSDLFPAVKKSGVKAYGVNRTRFGGPSNEFHSYTGLDKWADLDMDPGPIVQGFGGREGYDKFVEKIRPMLVESEYNVYRYRADLSYMNELAAPPSSGR